MSLPALSKPGFLRWAAALTIVSVFFYFFPLFHVVPLNAAMKHNSSKSFDAVAYVEDFWIGPLSEAARHAVDIADLCADLQHDPADAAARWGHRLGLGGVTAYLVSGQAYIVAVNDNEIAFSFEKTGPVRFLIELGPVFGNAIRDGTGLLDISDFSNTRDFNEISSEINRRVEEQVLPRLKSQATIGATIRFFGGVEVADTGGTPSILTVIPVGIEFL